MKDKIELGARIGRYWLTSDNMLIREWKIEEYVRNDPQETIIENINVGTSEIRKLDVVLHCLELREEYITDSKGENHSFVLSIDYKKDGNTLERIQKDKTEYAQYRAEDWITEFGF